MQTVDEKPIETLHVYVVSEEAARPPVFPLILSVLALSLLLLVCALSPYKQPVLRVAIRVPAVFLPLQSFTASAAIIPTGKKTYPATTAHVILTITNGSVISQELPKGLIFTGKTGMEVVTDTPVFVPAGSAVGYGYATVPAHAAVSGKTGNIPAYDIDRVEGSSIYIRNLISFHGGKDAYSVSLQLPQDRQTALDQSRERLFGQIAAGRLVKPCQETIKAGVRLVVIWTCQFFTYSVSPLVHVAHIKLSGKTVFVDGFLVARPQPFSGK